MRARLGFPQFPLITLRTAKFQTALPTTKFRNHPSSTPNAFPLRTSIFVTSAEEGLQSEQLQGLADLDGARVSEELHKILALDKDLRNLEKLFPAGWSPIRPVSDDIAKLAGAPRPKHKHVSMEQSLIRLPGKPQLPMVSGQFGVVALFRVTLQFLHTNAFR